MPNLKVRFFGLYELTQQIGNEEFDIQPAGDTFGDALRHLSERFGEPFRRIILADGGAVNPVIQVLLNEEEYLQRDAFNQRLKDGDELFFMFMIAGGLT